MNERKAVGPDTISTTFLELSCHYSIILSLCNIINSSIDDGTFPTVTFPTVWKSTKVFALYKSGSPSDIDNYRPISVLSICSKIIERHVHNSFSSYLSDNFLLCDSQSGFRKHNSCFTCLSKRINDWLHMLNTELYYTQF